MKIASLIKKSVTFAKKSEKIMSNIIAIVGRPNVGKSTLFNRLTKSRRAIVNEQAGTTRDRQYGKSEWNGSEFSVIDTGGWVVNSTDVFEDEIKRQVQLAIDEADTILFLVDVQNGITDLDSEVAKILRRTDKPVFLVANKSDTHEWQYDAAEFYRLGLGEPANISAQNGLGTGDLLDKVVDSFRKDATDEDLEHLPRIAFVGRPNAGKSSIINTLLDEQRTIVTEIAGTTRDSIYIRFNKFGHDFYLVDTAGIRKKAKVNEDIEYYSVVRSIRAIENADVCVLMIDATRGIESQDLNIFSLIQKNRKGLVVCVNKWDLAENKSNDSIKHFENAIRERLAPFTDFPIVFTSVIERQRILKAVQCAATVYQNKHRKVSTAKLNDFFLPLIENYPPPTFKGKYIKIKYVTQLPDTQTPAFVFFANLPQYIKEPYRRFLENKLRSTWDFNGTPVQLFFRQK
jgi:GTP-binding protein